MAMWTALEGATGGDVVMWCLFDVDTKGEPRPPPPEAVWLPAHLKTNGPTTKGRGGCISSIQERGPLGAMWTALEGATGHKPSAVGACVGAVPVGAPIRPRPVSQFLDTRKNVVEVCARLITHGYAAGASQRVWFSLRSTRVVELSKSELGVSGEKLCVRSSG